MKKLFFALCLFFSTFASAKDFSYEEIRQIQMCKGQVQCVGYAGYGGPCYAGHGGPLYSGHGGNCYAGHGGPCYEGFGGNCYSGGPSTKDCPIQCFTVCE